MPTKTLPSNCSSSSRQRKLPPTRRSARSERAASTAATKITRASGLKRIAIALDARREVGLSAGEPPTAQDLAAACLLAQRDFERIVEYRLSPLYVSVHATDPLWRATSASGTSTRSRA